ncbi:MAG: transcriptional regulator [Deltaproteobacteria bacterium]|nr:transcriptional regulator [Deltaproteobacteria bacterium]
MTPRRTDQTIRQQIIGVLSEKALTARDLSRVLGIREREVYDHLVHIARSLSAQNKSLVTMPYRCLGCGYVFDKRKRLTRPGRCPRCRGERIEEPRFQVETGAARK